MRTETSSRGLVGAETSSSSVGSGRGRLKSIIVRCSNSNSKRPRSTSPPPPITIKFKSKKKKKQEHVPCPPPLDVLFTRDRDFLVKNNGQKVSARHLEGKTVVLYIIKIDRDLYMETGDTLDMIQAYHELLPMGAFEFVLVPIYIDDNVHTQEEKFNYSARFNNLFSTIPFPAVPFSDIEACSHRVVRTFSVARFLFTFPYWAIVDPTGTVVATRDELHLFKLYGGAELYPLSPQRLLDIQADFGVGDRFEPRIRLIRNWDRLLASPTRDFLLSSNGAHVPISSLKGKLIGLYLCENIPCPPRMDAINKVYQEAKLCGYDFEIVQINFHFQFYYYAFHEADLSEQQHYENIKWLTLPFKDPSCRKLQRIFSCQFEDYTPWVGDCLVIVDLRQTDKLSFDFSGAEMIEKYGIQGYPFTRPSIYETEYTRLKKEVKLRLLFPPGLCQFTRHGFNLVNDSRLEGKRVLVLFAKSSVCKANIFISVLKSKYLKQEEDEFEVVYVSTDDCESSSFDECIQDMPWLVHPYSHKFGTWWCNRIFKLDQSMQAVAFDIDGNLISKEYLEYWQHCGVPEEIEPRFPFFSFSLDLRRSIYLENQSICRFDWYFDGEQVIREE